MYSIDVYWWELLNRKPHVPQIQKIAEIYQKWQPSQLVSASISLASKEVIKGIHAKSIKFAALSWALTLLCPCRGCSAAFFWLSMIVICLMLSLPLTSLLWERLCFVYEGIHAKSLKFVALSWALMLLCACSSCSVAFFRLSMIIVCLMLSLPLMLLIW